MSKRPAIGNTPFLRFFFIWLGAIATTGLIYLLARTGTGISVERLILGGVAVNSMFGAIQATLLLLNNEGRIQAALNWLIGSLNGRGWPGRIFCWRCSWE